MGAGSAKGLKQPEEDEEDSFSTSSEQWGNDPPFSDNGGRHNRDISPESDVVSKVTAPPSVVQNGGDTGAPEETMDGKKRTLFNFGKKKEEVEKDGVDDFVEDENKNDDKKKKGGNKNNKEQSKKESKGFRLFGGWRKDDKKSEEKEAELDEDIHDIEKTFDSLGIVGKNNWGDAPNNPPKETVDDLELLEPMRKRKNVRGRSRAPNGTPGMGGGGSEGGSTTSRRTFRYSWEMDTGATTPKQQDEDWEYKAVVIEGFDIEKFRKANVKEPVFDSSSLPNAIGEDYDGVKSPVRYDQNEQQILASIERDFIH